MLYYQASIANKPPRAILSEAALLPPTLFILSFVISRAIAARKPSDILKERANYATQSNSQAWDKWLSPAVAFGSVFNLPAAGLDDLFGWSPDLAFGLELISLALIVIGDILGSYAFVENAFFLELYACSQNVVRPLLRAVLTAGCGTPVTWIANPGIPLLLNALWAFLPVIIFGFFFAPCTHIEDHFYQANLPSYSDYAKKVR